MFDDSALRGFRMFWDIVNGEEIDEQDDADEQQLEEWEDVEEEESCTRRQETQLSASTKL